MNKLSLVGMQLPETYKENFDVSSKGPSTASIVFIVKRRFFCMLRNTRSKLMRIIYRLRL
jgi:hypothetical protein